MIPILYENTETTFTSNGIARLSDCIKCVVTEELNSGVYECDFQYPVSGDNFSEITLGRIIAVTHDDTGDIQPFDIVSYSKPIDGVVDFHAVHISYRLARYTAKVPNQTVNTIATAFTMFQNAYPQDGLWSYSAPGMGSPTAVMGATLDGIPKSVRQFIGGIEGSFLDTFGGEITWDKFSVIFKPQRGQLRDFTIRYGVNMTDYNEEVDSQEAFAYALPYWSDGTNLVVGNLVNSGLTDYDGHELCVALDLSDKFDAAPSVADLTTEATTFMTNNATNVPKQSIDVDFVRIQDLAGYEDYSNLLTCELGDSLNVLFPAYSVSAVFRIVRTEWNVLMNRFDLMTLGTLQTTLSEALGISTETGPIPGSGGGGATLWYGTCSTAAGTAAKAATITGFTDANITTGTVIWVKFSNANTASSPTLSINSGTAKSIMRYGTTAPSTSAASSWNAGEVVTLVYDGTNWLMADWLNTTYSSMTTAEIDAGTGATARLITPARLKYAIDQWVDVTQVVSTGTKIATVTTGDTATDIYAPTGGAGTRSVWYGPCSTAENTAAKTVTTSSGDFSLTAGNIVFVTFEHQLNVASSTLNVDSTGAKTIKQNGAAPQLFMWQDGETVGFVYDGTNFELIEAGQASTTEWGVTMLSSSVSDGYSNRAANGAAVKTAYDLADTANTLAGTKSTVAWSQSQTTGTQIATITIDGTPTSVYAPTGGGGSYTATAPISISAGNDISHDDAIGTTGSVGAANYTSGYGYYMPYVEYNAKGHIVDAYNLGTLIYQNNSTYYTGTNPVVLDIYSWAQALRTSSMGGFLMSAGSTTQSETISADARSVYSLRTNFRVADVQAYDVTTFEPVIVDWSCDKVFSAGGSITVTISIAQAYTHDIRWFPILTYATSAM